MSNRLKGQSSPYLLQHAQNPVDWYPWCEEAFQKAEEENKPIFLSIGYSTCHWCHVMAHESFENRQIAEILNSAFISIKVDREERPDIDSVYMDACQAFSGSGGWPMSIFMTAQQKPFFAGTYFPPVSGYGMIGFRDLLLTISEKWKHEKTKLLESAEQISELLNEKASEAAPGSAEQAREGVDDSLPKRAVELFSESYDEVHGGFGAAPKFPIPHNLIFLSLYEQINPKDAIRRQIRTTLDQMRRGGIFDQIGYGFSRYSTDVHYLVPHFEKMLYDNALLMIAYSTAYKAFGDKTFLDTAEKTGEYILREMTGDSGEFYSAQDADSEGEEGRFYVWQYREVCDILGMETGKEFCRYFGMTEEGNFEGKNIPNLLNGNEIANVFEEERQRLYDYRKARAKLHLDDKILTAWNALMICAMSILYRVTGKQRYLLAAEKAQMFIDKNLTDGEILYVSYRDGVRSVKGFLDEYAYDAAALLCLYEATAKPDYLQRAATVCREAMKQFTDTEGGYSLCGSQNSKLITKPKETYDGALPSGNSVMAYCLVRLSQLRQEEDFLRAAEKQMTFMSAKAGHYPAGYSMFLIALLLFHNPPQEITVVLSQDDDAGQILAQMPLYAHVRILAHETEGYKLLNGKTTYYICKNHTCLPPTNQINI